MMDKSILRSNVNDLVVIAVSVDCDMDDWEREFVEDINQIVLMSDGRIVTDLHINVLSMLWRKYCNREVIKHENKPTKEDIEFIAGGATAYCGSC